MVLYFIFGGISGLVYPGLHFFEFEVDPCSPYRALHHDLLPGCVFSNRYCSLKHQVCIVYPCFLHYLYINSRNPFPPFPHSLACLRLARKFTLAHM